MKVVLKKGPQSDLSTLVIFTAKEPKSGKLSMAKLSGDMQTLVEQAQIEAGFTGGKKESLFFRRANVDGYAHVLLVGLGEASEMT
ncbi:MAG: M17 family peptidase N-terminal domain-containing protein, partial [Bdellovibrionales bacterium]